MPWTPEDVAAIHARKRAEAKRQEQETIDHYMRELELVIEASTDFPLYFTGIYSSDADMLKAHLEGLGWYVDVQADMNPDRTGIQFAMSPGNRGTQNQST